MHMGRLSDVWSYFQRLDRAILLRHNHKFASENRQEINYTERSNNISFLIKEDKLKVQNINFNKTKNDRYHTKHNIKILLMSFRSLFYTLFYSVYYNFLNQDLFIINIKYQRNLFQT